MTFAKHIDILYGCIYIPLKFRRTSFISHFNNLLIYCIHNQDDNERKILILIEQRKVEVTTDFVSILIASRKLRYFFSIHILIFAFIDAMIKQYTIFFSIDST